ncbi:SURF1 family protein [Pelagibius sp. Alg239-R121]|uniref:SURF1 family protein n=1 Tax=Pelagibius sp. Alg239-R121 TaxID=2993448 RepID=UPI0024A64E5A|nr:SURF1 family protein [Pelagibius sp. Alg239-R121]
MSAPESSFGGKRRFRPSFWATAVTIPALIILLGLGTWQVQRLQWKQEQIELRQERAHAPVVPVSEVLDVPAEKEFFHVEVTGRFLHDKELYLAARSLNGNVGQHIVTPFQMSDGRVLLIDRGWVPSEKRDPETRSEGQIQGDGTVDGLLRLGGWKGYDFIRPDNDPAKNFWFYVDFEAMAVATGLENMIQTAYLDAGPAENAGGYPIGGQTRITLRNDHFQYVLTWYALALILAAVYFVYHFRPEEE